MKQHMSIIMKMLSTMRSTDSLQLSTADELSMGNEDSLTSF